MVSVRKYQMTFHFLRIPQHVPVDIRRWMPVQTCPSISTKYELQADVSSMWLIPLCPWIYIHYNACRPGTRVGKLETRQHISCLSNGAWSSEDTRLYLRNLPSGALEIKVNTHIGTQPNTEKMEATGTSRKLAYQIVLLFCLWKDNVRHLHGSNNI